jgi:hypothetical protein
MFFATYNFVGYFNEQQSHLYSHPVCGPAFTPIPKFHWYLQSKEILLHLSMRCWNWAFHAQGSRPVVQVREVKIYVTPMGAARKKERQDETQFTTKISEKH